jgi:hypothetical protein
MSLRNLGDRELALLRLYLGCRFGMLPQAFYAKWNVTHAQMAQICGCSEATVDRWFLGQSARHRPALVYLRRLGEMDLLWECYEELPLALRQRVCSPGPRSDQKLSE